ncbi:MAG: type II toxin-antitoxin system RelE/ParE family toxin [Planctomycetes bacterium]|nr:type II toxin-antitoxin system RelE/ParE family toxin [Planctomycetota bacterium]
MTPKPLEFHPKAIQESRAAKIWYADRSRKAELGFVRDLRHALNQVAAFPHRWPGYVYGTRRYVFRKYPYFLVYREWSDRIEVIALAHQQRRPGYWAERLP